MASPALQRTDEVKRVLYDSIVWRGLYYAVAFILNVLLARVFEAVVSGYILFIIAYYTLFVLLFGFSLESGIGYYASRQSIAPARLLNIAILWSVAAAILVLAVFSVYIPPSLQNFSFSFVLITAIVYITGHILMAFCNGFYYARKNFRLPNLISIVINVLLIVLLLVMAAGGLTEKETNIYLYVFFGSFFLQGLVLLVGSIIYFRIPLKISLANPGEYKLLVQYSFRAFVSNLVFFLLYRIDYWFVEEYCHAHDMGNYLQASKLANVFMIIPTIIGSAIFPLTAGGGRQEVNRQLQTIAKGIFVCYLVLCGLLALVGAWLFPLIYGDTFEKLYLVFLLLVPGILALATLSPFSAYYAGKDRISVNIKGSLLALIVIVGGDLLFIPSGGIYAAAVVSSIGYLVYQLYVTITFVKEYNLSVSGFFRISRQDLNRIRLLIVKTKDGNE